MDRGEFTQEQHGQRLKKGGKNEGLCTEENILRSKEMYLMDSISLYQTIRYPIQLNIFYKHETCALIQGNNLFDRHFFNTMNYFFACECERINLTKSCLLNSVPSLFESCFRTQRNIYLI